MSSSDNNLVELDLFRKSRGESTKSVSNKASKRDQETKVVGISGLRQNIIEEEKRKVKRTLLTEFIGASAILPGSGLVRVSLNDIAKGGLSFDVEQKYGMFQEGEQVALRVYLNHQTYFPLLIEITHIRLEGSKGYRHGAKFVQGTVNEEAVHHFVRFMETVSTSLRADLGDLLVSDKA